MEVDWEVFDLTVLINQIIDETSSMRKKGQQIMVEYQGDTHIRSDYKKLQHTVVNLVSNALKYSGENAEIKLKVQQANNVVTILVHDHGIGIPLEEQKHLFTKFFRAKNTNSIQGTGIGLTIAKLFVELMGGTITFSSHPDEGTLFTIHLPQSID